MNKRIKEKQKFKKAKSLSFNGNYQIVDSGTYDFKHVRRRYPSLNREDIQDFELLLITKDQVAYVTGYRYFYCSVIPTRFPGSQESKRAFRKRWNDFATCLDNCMRKNNLKFEDLTFLTWKEV